MKVPLLHCGGMDLKDIYFTLTEPPEPEQRENVFTVAGRQLDGHFMPQVNVPYGRHLLRSKAQLPSYTESIHQFVTRLQHGADYCQFELKETKTS